MRQDPRPRPGGLLLLLLFVCYVGAGTLCMHTHVVDGKAVTHAHPWKTPHRHSAQGLLTIGLLDYFVSTGEAPAGFDFGPDAVPVRPRAVRLRVLRCPHRARRGRRLRAPPFP